jgi:hypothetical protein
VPLFQSSLRRSFTTMFPYRTLRICLLLLPFLFVRDSEARVSRPKASRKTLLKTDRDYDNFFQFHSVRYTKNSSQASPANHVFQRPDIVAPRWSVSVHISFPRPTRNRARVLIQYRSGCMMRKRSHPDIGSLLPTKTWTKLNGVPRGYVAYMSNLSETPRRMC